MVDDERVRDFAYVTNVIGLKELQAELRRANPEMARKLQQVNKALVTRVAQRAAGEMYTRVDDVSPAIRTGPARTRPSGKGSIGASRRSIRGNASGREARIVAGGPKAPGFFGHEFGGSRGLGGRKPTAEIGTSSAFRSTVSKRGQARVRTRQFPIHKGKTGYFLYPEVRDALPNAFDEWNALFDDVMNTVEGPA